MLLAAFRAPSEQHDQLVSVSPEVDPVPGPAVDASFQHAGSDALAVSEVAQPHTRDCVVHQLPAASIEIKKPVVEAAG